MVTQRVRGAVEALLATNPEAADREEMTDHIRTVPAAEAERERRYGRCIAPAHIPTAPSVFQGVGYATSPARSTGHQRESGFPARTPAA